MKIATTTFELLDNILEYISNTPLCTKEKIRTAGLVSYEMDGAQLDANINQLIVDGKIKERHGVYTAVATPVEIGNNAKFIILLFAVLLGIIIAGFIFTLCRIYAHGIGVSIAITIATELCYCLFSGFVILSLNAK